MLAGSECRGEKCFRDWGPNSPLHSEHFAYVQVLGVKSSFTIHQKRQGGGGWGAARKRPPPPPWWARVSLGAPSLCGAHLTPNRALCAYLRVGAGTSRCVEALGPTFRPPCPPSERAAVTEGLAKPLTGPIGGGLGEGAGGQHRRTLTNHTRRRSF